MLTIILLLIPCIVFGQGLLFKSAVSGVSLGNGQWIGTSQAGGWTFTSDPYIYTTSASVGIGTTSPAASLDIREGTINYSDDHVDHGMTALTATNTYAHFQALSGSNGGCYGIGLTDADGTSPFYFYGVFGVTNPTATLPAVKFAASKKNGIATQGLENTETVFQVLNHTTEKITLLGSGNLGIGTITPNAALHILNATGPQFIITDTNKADSTTFEVGGDGDLTIVPTGGDVVIAGTINTADDGGSDDTYVATVTGFGTPAKGKQLILFAATINTGACTININAGGAVNIKTISGADPANSDILVDKPAILIHNGTDYTLTNPATTCD